MANIAALLTHPPRDNTVVAAKPAITTHLRITYRTCEGRT
jgi:hypothetical protein